MKYFEKYNDMKLYYLGNPIFDLQFSQHLQRQETRLSARNMYAGRQIKIYFMGIPVLEKGIDDFYFLSQKIDAEFYWFTYKISDDLTKKYKSIKFVSGLNDLQLRNKIKEMDLLVCPSHFEGFCLPIAEAIMNNKFVISYKLEEIYDVYADNIAYVEPFNFDEFINKINDFITNSALYDLEKSRRFIENNFSPDIICNKLLGIIENIR